MLNKSIIFALLSSSILFAGCSNLNEMGNTDGSSSAQSQISQPNSSQGASSSAAIDASASSAATSKSSSKISSSSQSKDPKSDGELAVADYFPLTHNYEAVFEGSGNEFAGFNRKYDYIDGNYVQMRSDNGGTSMANVYRVDETGVYKIFSQGEFYVRENYISRVKDREAEEIILQAPLEVGTTWQDGSGAHEITAIDANVTVPYGEFEAIEVTETQSDFVTKEYFVEGLGLVKTEAVFSDSNSGESFSVKSELSSLETDGWQEEIGIYQANDDATALNKVFVALDIQTNDIMRHKFTELFSGGQGLQVMFPEGTQIQALYTNWHIDPTSRLLQVDFNEGINNIQGSAAILLFYPAIMMTLADYYNTDQIVPTVNNEPLTINQVGQLAPGEPYPLDYSLVESEDGLEEEIQK